MFYERPILGLGYTPRIEVIFLSQYVDLLKQVPSGKEEVSEELMRKIKRAGFRLAVTQSGQDDIPPEERQEMTTKNNDCWLGSSVNPRVCNNEDEDRVLYLRREDRRTLTISEGSRREINALQTRLRVIRAKEGIFAYKAEVRRLRNEYLREKGFCHDDFKY